MALVLTTVGAALTTLIGVLAGSALSNHSQTRQWSRDRQADACAQVLRESSNMMIELAELDGQRVEPAPDGVRIRSPIDWKPWNEALAMVNLVADHEIVEAAHAIDAEIWPVHQQVKHGWTRDGDWHRLRSPIEVRRQEFVNVARSTSPRRVRHCGVLQDGLPTMIHSGRSDALTSRAARTSLTNLLARAQGEPVYLQAAWLSRSYTEHPT